MHAGVWHSLPFEYTFTIYDFETKVQYVLGTNGASGSHVARWVDSNGCGRTKTWGTVPPCGAGDEIALPAVITQLVSRRYVGTAPGESHDWWDVSSIDLPLYLRAKRDCSTDSVIIYAYDRAPSYYLSVPPNLMMIATGDGTCASAGPISPGVLA